MQISINTADPRPIYVQIMDEVRRAIVLGSLRPEDPLPSVRQLSSELRVNPNTVAQAYRELERAGAVYVRRGQGTFVAQTGAGEADRAEMVRGVAERALVEAHRSGVSVQELMDAIREASASREPSTPAGQS